MLGWLFNDGKDSTDQIARRLQLIPWHKNNRAISRAELWHTSRQHANDSAFYKSMVTAMLEMRGCFTLSYRCNPFRGFVVDPNWDHPWRDHMIDETEMHAWTGTGTTYEYRNELRPGNTIVRAYAGNAETRNMLTKASCFHDWRPSLPEDLALYDWKGRIVCFTIAHESEVHIRRDLALSHILQAIGKSKN